MSYQPLFFECTCGCTPSRIDEVGLSDERELVVHWWCEDCCKVVYKAIPLAACVESCPPREAAVDDATFLASLGISPE